MISKPLNISCVWGGTLAGILLKSDLAATSQLFHNTTKVLGIHGWLDNLNSMLPIAQRLLKRRSGEYIRIEIEYRFRIKHSTNIFFMYDMATV